MSTDESRSKISQLNSDIATLQKKSAELGKKEAAARSKAAKAQSEMARTSSPSMHRSHQRDLERYSTAAAAAAASKASFDKRIAAKMKSLSTATAKLHREEANDKRKDVRTQSIVQERYERRIDELSSQLNQATGVKESSVRRHLCNEPNEEEFDVFISHAWEDKESIADALFRALSDRQVKVWYDEISVAWGDSLRAKIDNGLKKSKFGIVILSHHYISKGWTQYELDGLFQIEMTSGKVILPIWHNISRDEVFAFSPTLAGRKALTTAILSAEQIADELTKILAVVASEKALANTEAILEETSDDPT